MTTLPLLKDKMGDIESGDNNRSIALSSVMSKIYDLVVMILRSEKLQLDELQFSYQKNCTTTMCTWLVVETVSHFARNGKERFTSLFTLILLSPLLDGLQNMINKMGNILC